MHDGKSVKTKEEMMYHLHKYVCLYANVSKHLSQELKIEHKTELSYWKSYLSNQVSATSQDG